MRKFNARWWVTAELIQWRYMAECGDYPGPFFEFPDINPQRFPYPATAFMVLL